VKDGYDVNHIPILGVALGGFISDTLECKDVVGILCLNNSLLAHELGLRITH
jgi:hypothetical protein